MDPTPRNQVLSSKWLSPLEKNLIKILYTFKERVESNPLSKPLEMYFAGGWVRDKLIQASSRDIDIVMTTDHIDYFAEFIVTDFQELTPKPTSKVFKAPVNLNGDTSEKKFCQAKIYGLQLDIRGLTTSLNVDLQTRDFTCNSLYFNPFNYEITDLVNGIDDIYKRIIRPVGSFERTFLLDPSRFIRVVRLSVSKKLKISPELKDQISTYLASENARNLLSQEEVFYSIYSEFRKTLRESFFVSIIEKMHKLGVHRVLFGTESIGKFDINEFVSYLRTVELLLSSIVYRDMSCNAILKLSKRMAFRNMYVYYNYKKGLSTKDLPKLIRSEETSQYLESVLSAPEPAPFVLNIQSIDFFKERKCNYPILTVLLAAFHTEIAEGLTKARIDQNNNLADFTSPGIALVIEYLKACIRAREANKNEALAEIIHEIANLQVQEEEDAFEPSIPV